MDENTASAWAAEFSSCSVAEGWAFEWAYPGDYPGGSDYHGPFTGSFDVDISGDPAYIRVREIKQDEYYFAYLKCSGDTGNGSDNLDLVQNPDGLVGGEDYYCVAWNVPIPTTGTIWNVKVVTNDESDTASFSAEVERTDDDGGYLAEFAQGSPHKEEDVPEGWFASTEDDPGPDYRWLATTAHDAEDLLWDADSGEPICPS